MRFVKLTRNSKAVWVNLDLVARIRPHAEGAELLLAGMPYEGTVVVEQTPDQVIELAAGPTT